MKQVNHVTLIANMHTVSDFENHEIVFLTFVILSIVLTS